MNSIIPYLTVITTVLAAYFAFRHQQRLKAFELFYSRRATVLTDIEVQLDKLFSVQSQREQEKDDALAGYQLRFFHDGLVLYHKVKGANFGKTVGILADSYFTIIQEPLNKGYKIDWDSWLGRNRNILSVLYGAAHSSLSYEIEMLTLPFPQRCFRSGQRWFDRIRSQKKHEKQSKKA